MISSQDLAQLRNDVSAALTDTCTIISTSVTPDGQGGFTESEPTSTESACLVLPPITRPTEEDAGGAVVGVQIVPILLPVDAIVSRDNRIEVRGTTYEVVGIPNQTNAVTKRVTCVEVK